MRIVSKKHINGIRIYNERGIIAIIVLLMVISGITMLLYKMDIIRYGILLIGLLIAFVKHDKIINILRQLKEK